MAYRNSRNARGLANVLGCLSLAVGAAELIAPHVFTRAFGLRGGQRTVQGHGLRGIATGAGILIAADPAPWVWSRLAGHALDAATLARSVEADRNQQANAQMALAAVAGMAMVDAICVRRLGIRARRSRSAPARDYSDRSGLPRPPEQMRGVARDFRIPRDYRLPEGMRPYPEN